MNDQTRSLVGRSLAGVAVIGAAASVAVLLLIGKWTFLVEEFGLHNVVAAIGLGLIAWVAFGTQARNGAVWALAWSAFFGMLQAAGVASVALFERADPTLFAPTSSPSEWPLGAAIANQTVSWTWIPSVFILLTIWLLLFPDGKPLSPRWRWVGWFSAALITVSAVSFAWATRPSSTENFASETEGNVEGLIAFGLLALLLLIPTSLLSASSLVLRYRRSSGMARQQIRWIAWGGSVLAVSMAWLIPAGVVSGGGLSGLIALAGEVLLIIAIAIAMTRYRLYDIDVVISRTVTYGALALFITAVYVAIVVGVGSLVGQGDEPNLALAIVATAAVALLFEPIRRRLQAWANRLVYGDRATPYSVLSEMSVRFSDAGPSEDRLKRLAQLITSGTGADEAVVWLRVGDRLRPEAFTSSDTPRSVNLDSGLLPELPGDAASAIEHAGELLGALSIGKSKAEPVTPADQQLLHDVAAGAGLLLRNIQLNAELTDRAEELRFSRRRLVAAQDLERRKLERNLHDGAQQQVVALKVKLGLAKTMAEREGVEPVADAVGDLADDTQRAVDGMRAAARGIYPPLLEAEGVRAALVAAGRDASRPVEVEDDGFGRYPPEIEATIYFSVLEAIGPVGGPEVAHVNLGDTGEMVSFSVHSAPVEPASVHGLTAVVDRVEALGGTLDVETFPDGDRRIVGRLPVTAMDPA